MIKSLHLLILVTVGVTNLMAMDQQNQLVNCKNILSWTPLHTAASLGNVEQAKILLEFGAAIDATDDKSKTPLLHGAQMGKLGVVQLLAQKGAHLNAADNKGTMPIHASCKEGHCDVVTFLIEKGVSVLSTDSDNKSALEYALAYRNFSDSSVLLAIQAAMKKKHDAEIAGQGFALQRAVQNASIDEIEKLVAEGAKLDELDKSGNTALHYAAGHTNPEVLKTLLAAHKKKNETSTAIPVVLPSASLVAPSQP